MVQKASVVGLACDLCTQEADTGKSRVQGHLHLCCQFKASMSLVSVEGRLKTKQTPTPKAEQMEE